MRHRHLTLPLIATLLVIAMEGCKKEHRNDPEKINMVRLQFLPNAWSPPDRGERTFEFYAPDASAGMPPGTNVIPLSAGQTFTVNISFYYKDGNNYTDLTGEIHREPTAHRVYVDTGGVNSPLTVLSVNAGDNGKLIGTSGWWVLNKQPEREIKVILRHYAGNPPGKENSDPVNSPKSTTDIEATFIVRPL